MAETCFVLCSTDSLKIEIKSDCVFCKAHPYIFCFTTRLYYLVSLLSVASNIFEKLVNNNIADHLEKYGVFSDSINYIPSDSYV